MKKTILIPFILLAVSCGGHKNTVSPMTENYTVESGCPEEGNCTLEVLQDKSLDIKTDGTGKLYYGLKDTPGKNVVKYTYKKDTDAQLQDAGYSEEIVFETDTDVNGFNYSATDMQKSNMLFGVMCFCRGKAGYYKVTSGNVVYKDNKLSIELPDIVDDQKLDTIMVFFK